MEREGRTTTTQHSIKAWCGEVWQMSSGSKSLWVACKSTGRSEKWVSRSICTGPQQRAEPSSSSPGPSTKWSKNRDHLDRMGNNREVAPHHRGELDSIVQVGQQRLGSKPDRQWKVGLGKIHSENSRHHTGQPKNLAEVQNYYHRRDSLNLQSHFKGRGAWEEGRRRDRLWAAHQSARKL